MATLPIDPIYTGQLGAINLNYQNQLAGIGYDQTQVGQTYGFNAQGGLDPTNPYSVAANLQKRYQEGQRGTTNSFAASGQLYSGALGRNLAEGTYQYSRNYDSARRDAQDAYQGLAERRQGAEFNRSVDSGNASADRLSRLDPNAVVPNTPAKTAAKKRINPTKTKSHVAAGLKRVGTNTYIGPNGTYWHRTKSGYFARGKG